ncbi:MAG TPA: DegT/DnrJ/EryC1/StrS family aminotransferase [Thermomicrobiales bacterium]|nr:DegT/DnrJ/EryC1/StrS family aminotransferase [Thermomicrobiales bacterium]
MRDRGSTATIAGGVTTDRLAIDGGQPVRTEPFPSWPVFDDREERQLLDVLHSGKWGATAGDKVHTFEQRFAEYQQARFGVCVPNGTLALELALYALDLGPGDEVIVPAYTFIATANAVLSTGALPLFVDVDPRTLNIDPVAIEAAITPRTKAILPVHIAGQPANMDAVLAIARQHNLRVVEDACQAWGAEWQGHRVGALGDLGAFSFQSGKNITAGEGGIVVTNDPDLHARCWSLHNVGRVPGGRWYQHENLGWNLRMSEWQGAVLLPQLDRLPAATRLRDEAAQYLIDALGQIEGITPPIIDERVTQHAWHLFIMRYDSVAFGGHSRDEFLAALQAEGIPGAEGYIPLPRCPAIPRSIERLFGTEGLATLHDCPEADRASADAVWLGQTVLLADRAALDDIVAAFWKIKHAWTPAS